MPSAIGFRSEGGIVDGTVVLSDDVLAAASVEDSRLRPVEDSSVSSFSNGSETLPQWAVCETGTTSRAADASVVADVADVVDSRPKESRRTGPGLFRIATRPNEPVRVSGLPPSPRPQEVVRLKALPISLLAWSIFAR